MGTRLKRKILTKALLSAAVILEAFLRISSLQIHFKTSVGSWLFSFLEWNFSGDSSWLQYHQMSSNNAHSSFEIKSKSFRNFDFHLGCRNEGNLTRVIEAIGRQPDQLNGITSARSYNHFTKRQPTRNNHHQLLAGATNTWRLKCSVKDTFLNLFPNEY